MPPALNAVLLIVVCLSLAACAPQPEKTAAPPLEVKSLPPAPVSTQPPREVDRLDIGIVVFDPGVPADASTHRELGIFPLIRKAESRYLPFLLRRALVDSGQWGAVRVMPRTYQSSELLVKGKILASNGEVLVLAIRAEDSAGRVWLDTAYRHTAGEEDYASSKVDPFQLIFTRIAKDLLLARSRLGAAELREIAQVSSLRYAAEISPEAFEQYLRKDETGIYRISRLPAEGDPQLRRIDRIRQYEYLFIDTADEHYLNLFDDIKKTYGLWRQYSRELLLYIRDEESRDKDNEFRRGSFAWISANYANYEWFRRQEQLMEELSSGFNNEIVPTVLQMEDSVVELSGDLDDQYAQWRRILRSLLELERGPLSP